MVEICPWTGVVSQSKPGRWFFSTAKDRTSLVTKLLNENDMLKAGSLEVLPQSEAIVGAILGESKSIT